MDYTIAEGLWVFRRFDTYDDETPFRFTFLRWVISGDRDDFAAIEITDTWTDYRDVVHDRVFLAARHVGVDLCALKEDDIPAHAHLLTAPAELLNESDIDPDQFQRDSWITVEPADWRDTHPGQPGDLAYRPPVVYQRRKAPGSSSRGS